MPRDAAATRARILAAAVQEFAAYGLAGGRIDRIARAAAANPRMIYVHFGNKERLFDGVVDHVLGALGVEVPMTEDNLPDFAGRRFDQLQARPEAIRINLWRFLERPQAGPDDTELYSAKVTNLSRSRSAADAGSPPVAAADLLILVANMAAAWVSTSPDLLAADGADPRDPQRLARHRAALVDAVSALSGQPADGAAPHAPRQPGPL